MEKNPKWRVLLLALTGGLVLAAAHPALAQDVPAIAKDSVRVKADNVDSITINGRRQEGSSWLPTIDFRVRPGPSTATR